MRVFRGEVTLDLQSNQWALLVAALQNSRGMYMNRVLKATHEGKTFGIESWTEAVQELSELLAVLDPEGEHREAEFDAQMMQKNLDEGKSTILDADGWPL